MACSRRHVHELTRGDYQVLRQEAGEAKFRLTNKTMF
jgi:hypothetical protein